MKFFYLALLFLSLFTSCQSNYFDEIPLSLEPSVYGVDAQNKLILYNGDSIDIQQGVLAIGNDIFKLSTEHDHLLKGHEYVLELDDEEYIFFYTELPILVIETDGERIDDEIKTHGTLYLMEHSKECIISLIGIELAGYTSLSYPKKSYGFELWEDIHGKSTKKLPLLGLRDDDDWILDGMWNEAIRIRDVSSHAIWLDMARAEELEKDSKAGINTAYCEVFVNGVYRGVYYLGEKIDRKQLGLERFIYKMEGELYKGKFWKPGTTFDGLSDFNNESFSWNGYEIEFPEEPGQFTWSPLYNFVDLVVNAEKSLFDAEIANVLDLNNARDYFIFINFIGAIDNYGKNVFTAKVNESGKYFFLPWDMDATFGRDYQSKKTSEDNYILSNNLFNRLIQNEQYKEQLKERWLELRNTKLDQERVSALLRENHALLSSNEVYYRESFVKELDDNFAESEIEYITQWLGNHIQFLDNYFEGL